MAAQLTASLEDYLEVIAELTATYGHAHTKEIAQKLNVKMPSVTGALHQLVKKGYIIYNSHYPVQLTDEGKRVADEVTRRHRILKKFFTDILHLSPEKASATACHLEHVVDEDTIRRFVVFSQAIESRSDAEKLQVFLAEAMALLDDADGKNIVTLAELADGESAAVEFFGKNLAPADIPPLQSGDIIECHCENCQSIRIKNGDSFSQIPISIAENIWVSKSL